MTLFICWMAGCTPFLSSPVRERSAFHCPWFALSICHFCLHVWSLALRQSYRTSGEQTPNCIRRLFEESESISAHTTGAPGKALLLSFFCIVSFCLCLAFWQRIVFYPLTWPAIPSTFLRSLAVFGKKIRRRVFNISWCVCLLRWWNIILCHCTTCYPFSTAREWKNKLWGGRGDTEDLNRL